MSEVAAKKLAKADDPRVVEALIGTLQGRPDIIRMTSIRSLGEIGDKAATKVLIRLLGDSNATVASAAADALGAISDPGAVPYLIKILKKHKDSSRHFQIHGFQRGLYMAAIHALERIGTSEARKAVHQYHR